MKYLALFFTCSSALLFGAKEACSEPVTFPVVGVYDGSEEGNDVDRDASFFSANSSGGGVDASLCIGIGDFRREIYEAYTNGCGGVVDFDNEVIAGGTQSDSFYATFGGGKSLLVQSDDHLRTDMDDTACMPISGPGEAPSGGFLAKSNVGEDKVKNSTFSFTLEELGFASQEHVRAIGATILGRNGAADTSKWLMKVTLNNGDTVAQVAEINFRSGKAKDDTFFGIKAPIGRYITSVQWINLDGNYTGLDGFAFITNGSPRKQRIHRGPGKDDSSSMSLFGVTID